MVAAILMASCASGPQEPRAVPLEGGESPQELRALLKDLGDRTDAEACIGRARICNRLRGTHGDTSQDLLRLGDEGDLLVLASSMDPEVKRESSLRLAAHFQERATSPEVCQLNFECDLASALRTHVFLSIAARFHEFGAGSVSSDVLKLQAAAARALGEEKLLKAEARLFWRRRAQVLASRASRPVAKSEITKDVRRFCQDDAARHLEVAQRAADAGTREKASRGDLEKVTEWYLEALVRYAVAGECLSAPSEGQQLTLAGMGIVAHSLSDMLRREKGE